ncbi:MAG: TraM recognition domain-containing protein [Corynebacterium sp.]|nr:TraM recognition domain-containing protein [Corynebacterium sp.]
MRRSQSVPRTDPGMMILLALMGAFAALGLGAWAALTLSQKLTGQPQHSVPINPFELFIGLYQGHIQWTVTATGISVLMAVIVVILVTAWALLAAPKKDAAGIDSISHLLASSTERATLSKSHAARKAAAWLPSTLATTHPGLMFGWKPGSKRKTEYWSTWEDLYLIIFGPRRGKTTSQVIPAIVDAPGNVVTTSNKRDIVDDTIGITQARGQVWVFDPQNIAAGFQQRVWYFDPLDAIRHTMRLADAQAYKLADIFYAASRAEGAPTGDSYFSSAAKDLLARLFLAAAVDNRPISDVFGWVNNDQDRAPIGILRRYPEWQQLADALNATYNITERTRSGIFSQAAQMAAPLGRREAVRWVTGDGYAVKFNAADFVRGKADTLYVLSKEGADNAAALTTALVAAVMEAAERYGEECGGRLPVPLVAPLDEAANVVRWPELPRLYSHYGSRSIILMTILQSYAQGVGVWGEHGMESLWSAATVLIYGGGVRDEKMLTKLEALIGEAQELSRSASRSRDGRSTSYQLHEKKILTIAELAALESHRAVVFATSRRPVLIELPYYWLRPWPRHIRQLLRLEKDKP